MKRYLAAIVAALFCFLTVPAAAATTGVVRGNVIVNNAPKAGVVLQLFGEGAKYNASTDSSGNYVFQQIPFGHYTLTAHSAGVADKSLGLDVQSDQVLQINIALGELKVIASANVTSRAGVTGTPTSSNALGHQQLAALPTNTSLNRVVQTVPGIIRFSYDEPVAHGFHGVTYEIDGAPLPQATSSNFAEIIDPKNIDSLEIFTGAFPAEYGGSRQGAVINIVSNRANDVTAANPGSVTVGAGNYGQSQVSLSESEKFGKTALFFSANSQRSSRGLDTPTYQPIHDNASQSDQFLRLITPVGGRGSLAFDYSNQLAQFQIPINTDPNNVLLDPVVQKPGTDDVQREYDRYANLNFTNTSAGGNAVFQIVPWYRSTRIAYDGDIANEVQALQYDPTGQSAPTPVGVGLRQDRRATYAGVRVSNLVSSQHHTIKIGADFSRENFDASQLLAFTDPNSGALVQNAENVSQPGTQVGLYAQDKWTPSRAVSVSYGLRYDHSTGFTGGWMLSPRIGVNIAPDDKNIVHFYYGRMYAAPQLEDVRNDCVALSAIGSTCSTTPAYDLKPERDAYAEMGLAHTFSPNLSGYVNYFNRTAVNVLDTTQLLNTPLFAVFNNAIGRDEGFELRLQGKRPNGDSWFASGTYSHAEASCPSGSTFLFTPDQVCTGTVTAANLSDEDHDQLWEGNAAYTHRFGQQKKLFATLQGEYGTGFPVTFQNTGAGGRLPAHLTFDLGIGREASREGHSLGFAFDVDNLLNHQYVIKIANGFNTTQVATGRKVLLRLTAPL